MPTSLRRGSGLLAVLLVALLACLVMRRAAAPCEAFTAAVRQLPMPADHSAEYDPALDDLQVPWEAHSASNRGCGFCLG
eukprot:s172_g15.t1